MTTTALLGALRLSGRLASLLPVVACATFVMLIIVSGAPGAPPDAGRLRRALAGVGAGETALLVLGLIVAALLLDPLQLRLVRLLEGEWPRSLARLSRWSAGRQRARRDVLAGARRLMTGSTPSGVQVQRAGEAGELLRRRFARDSEPPRPTALGNTLAAMEDRAGLPYGWDAVVAWPRLYPLLSSEVRFVVDGQRERLDTLARLSVCSAVTAILTTLLLYASGWWMLLAVGPAGIARAAYVGAVQTAMAYGRAVEVAFDLHRFDLLRQLHLPLPPGAGAERALSAEVCLMWRQEGDLSLRYDHDGHSDPPG
ncbi:hypothetical protein ACIRF8_12100 [Streptomyces sp. NPDC102406]|uniref:hypothetical protein n=1 Tax=Streptomyces sp. NPDC102406 TaxID=3366171 RepID=UPI003823F6B3